MTGTAKPKEEFRRSTTWMVALPTYKPIIRGCLTWSIAPRESNSKRCDDIVNRTKTAALSWSARWRLRPANMSANCSSRGINMGANAKNHGAGDDYRPGRTLLRSPLQHGRAGWTSCWVGNYEELAREQLRRERSNWADPQMAGKSPRPAQTRQRPNHCLPTPAGPRLSLKYAEVKKMATRCGYGWPPRRRYGRHEAAYRQPVRSGRLGDRAAIASTSALEDDLMRRFGGERISGIMSRLGVEGILPIEAGLVTSHRKCADQVEGHNFDIRKHVLQYQRRGQRPET